MGRSSGPGQRSLSGPTEPQEGLWRGRPSLRPRRALDSPRRCLTADPHSAWGGEPHLSPRPCPGRGSLWLGPSWCMGDPVMRQAVCAAPLSPVEEQDGASEHWAPGRWGQGRHVWDPAGEPEQGGLPRDGWAGGVLWGCAPCLRCPPLPGVPPPDPQCQLPEPRCVFQSFCFCLWFIVLRSTLDDQGLPFPFPTSKAPVGRGRQGTGVSLSHGDKGGEE